jgi:hypothetical protein
MRSLFPVRLLLTISLLAMLLPLAVSAQDVGGQDLSAQDLNDPNDAPLGDVARSMRKKGGSQDVIDNDNLAKVMAQSEIHRPSDSVFKFLMDGEEKGFHVSAPDVTCSLSFSANTKALLANQYAQMELPAGEMHKLEGPAAIEGDALQVSLYNGTDWHVSEVAVALTIVKKVEASGAAMLGGFGHLIPAAAGGMEQASDVRPEKNSDVTVLYRMRAAASPAATTIFSAPLNLELTPEQEWHWAIMQAKGYPPQSAIAGSVGAISHSAESTLVPMRTELQDVQPSSTASQDAPVR